MLAPKGTTMKAAFFPFVLLVLATVVTLLAPLAAQTPDSNASAALKAELTHGIDARKAKVGDPVLAKCMSNFVSRARSASLRIQS
jgi:hypothetical protein